MKKCDFCKYSHLKNGKLVCPYSICVLNNNELKEIYDVIKREKE